MNNNQDKKNNNGLGIDPSELIGRHFSINRETSKHENIETQKHRNTKNIETRKHKNIETQKHRNKKTRKEKEKTASPEMSRDKDPYEDLVTRLEGKLNGKSFEGLIDFRDEQVPTQEVGIPTENVGKKQNDIIDELQEKLLPNQDIDPKEELEAPEDLELPMGDNTQDTINNKQEKDKIKREIRNKKEKQENKKIKKQEKERIKKEIKNKKLEIKEKKKLEKTQLKEEQLRVKTLEKIKIKQKIEKEKNKQTEINFKNYINIIKFPVIFLVGIELLIYIFSLDAILPLIILLNIIVFILLAIKALKRYNYNQWLAIKICLLAGIIVGLFRAIFIMIWVSESWTIINLATEPAVIGLTAGVIGLIVGLFVKKKVMSNG